MPRHARLVIPDLALHVVQRGHDRRDCFRQEADYLVYLSNLRDLLARTGCLLHAYCLMTNHVHLLLTPAPRMPVRC
jgi:putative transposase